MRALFGLLMLANAARLRRDPMPSFLSLLSRFNSATQNETHYGEDAKETFISECIGVVSVRFEEYLPTSAIRAMCEGVDRGTECREHADTLVATFRSGTGNFTGWCGDFYEWFKAQHGDLCPTQCSKFMCKPKCKWLEHIAELDEAESLLLKEAAENEKKRVEVETSDLELKEMDFEHEQLQMKLNSSSEHAEKVEAELEHERTKLEEAMNATKAAEEKANARDLAVSDLEEKISGMDENLTQLGFHIDEVNIKYQGAKREAERLAQVEKESEEELLVMLGNAEAAGEKVSTTEAKLEAELADMNATNVTLRSDRAEVEEELAPVNDDIDNLTARVAEFTANANRTRDQDVQLQMDEVMLKSKKGIAEKLMQKLAAIVTREKALAKRLFESKYVRKDLEQDEDRLAEVMAQAEALNETLNASKVNAATHLAKAETVDEEIAMLEAEKKALIGNITESQDELKTARITAGFVHEALTEKQASEKKQQSRVTRSEYRLSEAENEVTTLTVESTELEDEIAAQVNTTDATRREYEAAANATAKAREDLAAERALAEDREPEP
jgi:chromosome segregation ATPase